MEREHPEFLYDIGESQPFPSNSELNLLPCSFPSTFPGCWQWQWHYEQPVSVSWNWGWQIFFLRPGFFSNCSSKRMWSNKWNYFCHSNICQIHHVNISKLSIVRPFMVFVYFSAVTYISLLVKYILTVSMQILKDQCVHLLRTRSWLHWRQSWWVEIENLQISDWNPLVLLAVIGWRMPDVSKVAMYVEGWRVKSISWACPIDQVNYRSLLSISINIPRLSNIKTWQTSWILIRSKLCKSTLNSF